MSTKHCLWGGRKVIKKQKNTIPKLFLIKLYFHFAATVWITLVFLTSWQIYCKNVFRLEKLFSNEQEYWGLLLQLGKMVFSSIKWYLNIDHHWPLFHWFSCFKKNIFCKEIKIKKYLPSISAGIWTINLLSITLDKIYHPPKQHKQKHSFCI